MVADGSAQGILLLGSQDHIAIPSA
jgi:hypothetical protein